MPYYPANNLKDICVTCYTGTQSVRTSANCSGDNTTPYCDTCNTKCDKAMTFCSQGIENIASHGDVGAFGGFGASKDAIIATTWTASKWNDLQALYKKANTVGYTQSQGATLSFTSATSNGIIKASMYNEFVDAAKSFRNTISSVSKDDLITAALSTALETGYSNAKFNTNVCDICNTGAQYECSYNCSCNYDCCNYNCSCNYQCRHDCGKNVTPTPTPVAM